MSHNNFQDSNSNGRHFFTHQSSTLNYLQECEIVPSLDHHRLISKTQLKEVKSAQRGGGRGWDEKRQNLQDVWEDWKEDQLTRESSINTSVSSRVGKNKKKAVENGRQKNCVKQGQIGEKGQEGKKYFNQFFEYVLKFKLQCKGSYNPKTKLTKQQPPSHQQNFQPPKVISFEQLKENCRKKSKIHEGYSCNGCAAEPIVGTRYHCSHEECQNDYDLCGDCFKKTQHEHQLVGIDENGLEKHLKGLDELIEKGKKSVSRSVISMPNKFKNDKPLWFSHIK